MRKNKLFIIANCVIIFLIIISAFYTSYASTITDKLVSGMNTQLRNPANPTKNSSFIYLLSRIFSAIQFIGTGISIIIITRLGITYMMSSVEEKAQIKQRAVPILLGTFVLVATVNILKFIQVFVTN